MTLCLISQSDCLSILQLCHVHNNYNVLIYIIFPFIDAMCQVIVLFSQSFQIW